MKIALIVLDSVRKDHLSPYGGPIEITPTVDRVAKSGVVFTNCIAGAPWTPASHATMFTGEYPSNHGVRADNLAFPKTGQYLPEILSDAGIKTQCVGSEPWLSRRQGVDRGWDVFHDTGGHSPLHYLPFLPAGIRYAVDRASNVVGTDYGTGRFSIHLFNQLARRSDSFTFVNIPVAHSPYDAPDVFGERLNSQESVHPFVNDQEFYRYIGGERDPGPEAWETVRERYAAGVAHADHLLKQALDGLDDDTWIILTADHGEHLGEDGLAVHQFSLRDELVNVPLIVAHPSLDHDLEDRMVSHVDIAPTVYDIVRQNGFDPRPDDDLPGESLLGEGSEDRVVFSEYGPPVVATNTLINRCERLSRDRIDEWFTGLQAAVSDKYKLIRTDDGEEALYQRCDETTPVTVPDIAARLRSAMENSLGPLPNVDPEVLDAYVDASVEEELADLGYL